MLPGSRSPASATPRTKKQRPTRHGRTLLCGHSCAKEVQGHHDIFADCRRTPCVTYQGDNVPGEACPMTTYADAHPLYRAAGWAGPLPLPAGRKYPPPEGWTGWVAPYPSGADSTAWADEAPLDNGPDYRGTTQLGLRMHGTVVGIDVDHYGEKRGGDTLAEAERRWGPLPAAPRSTARGAASPSGIRFFRVPDGTTLATVIRFKELGLGDIEVIQRHHRYAVAWPSTNPHADDAPYLWLDDCGPDAQPLDGPPRVDMLNALPELWLENLRSEAQAGEVGATDAVVAAFMREHSTGSNRAAVRGMVAVFERESAHSTRHDAVLNAACMAAREVRAGHYSAAEAVEALRTRFVQSMAEAKAGQRLLQPVDARREFASVWAWAVAQALVLTPDTARERTGVREPASASGVLPPARMMNPGHAVSAAAIGTPTTSVAVEPAGSHLRVVAEGEAPGLDPESGWRPLDLGPYLDGNVERPTATVGLCRRDGVHLFYPGKEHAVIGEMESGKSWVSLSSVAAELDAGHVVVYVHFEEDDPSDTIERLLLLGAAPAAIRERFLFVSPSYAITPDVVEHYIGQHPTLVILDGQNEAMALHGLGIREEDGAAAYRRLLVKPFTAAGAAVISCDHVVKDSEKSAKGYALGSIHKGNGINGTIVLLENVEPFGRGRRGASSVFVTKDRPGQVRQHGEPTDVARKFYMGTVSVDATDEDTLSLVFWPPADREADPFAAGRGEEAWDAPTRPAVPADVVAYRGAGQKSILDLARFIRTHGQGGIGVDLTAAKQALCGAHRKGKVQHDKETVNRAWGALYDAGRITAAESNGNGNPRGLHWWVVRDGDPE